MFKLVKKDERSIPSVCTGLNVLPKGESKMRQKAQNSVLSGSLSVTNYRVTISKNAKFHNKSKVFGEFCFDFCQR